MIIKAIAIPLAWYPYSSTSRVVHWLSRHHGRISTILKGALRPKSPFLGEYELFSTSELLYFNKPAGGLYPAKECALLTPRNEFRSDWRAALSASYIAALVARTTPDEAPLPGLFERYEEMLDMAAEFGSHPAFTVWAELQLCDYHGHAPHLTNCLQCATPNQLRFSAAAGGTICGACATEHKMATLECPPDVLALLRRCQQSPQAISSIKANVQQQTMLNGLMERFVGHHLNIPPAIRQAAQIPA